MSHSELLSFDDKIKKITLRGTLSFATCMSVYNRSLPIINQEQSKIDIDFSEMNCVDSSIIALLVEWYKYTHNHPRQLHIIHLPEHIQSLLKIAGLDEVLKKFFIPAAPVASH